MNSRAVLLSLLLTSTLTAGVLGQSNPTPINHLLNVIQASKNELTNAAQISSAQQAYSVVTRVVNQILKAMQTLSLPYYQGQLVYLENQQISLSNRLTALQAKVGSEASMLLKMTGMVSSSLAAQTANIGSVLMAFINVIDPKIGQLNAKLAGIAAVIPQAVQIIQDASSKRPALESAMNGLASQLAAIEAEKNAVISKINRQLSVIFAIDPNFPNFSNSAIPYCKRISADTGFLPGLPIYSYFVYPSTISTAINTILEVVSIQEAGTSAEFLLCSRDKTAFPVDINYLYFEVEIS